MTLDAFIRRALIKPDVTALINKLTSRPFPAASRTPQLSKHASRMKHSHAGDSKNDERSLKDHEASLVVGEMTTEPLPQFGNAVDAADEDENSGNEQTYHVSSELA